MDNISEAQTDIITVQHSDLIHQQHNFMPTSSVSQEPLFIAATTAATSEHNIGEFAEDDDDVRICFFFLFF